MPSINNAKKLAAEWLTKIWRKFQNSAVTEIAQSEPTFGVAAKHVA